MMDLLSLYDLLAVDAVIVIVDNKSSVKGLHAAADIP